MKIRFKNRLFGIFIIFMSMFILTLFSSCVYMKMNPPPDVDKSAHGHTGTLTCWIATASNMLAGAGYGTGSTVQQRADNIYGQLVAHFGTGSGWTDTALNWWLSSSHNTWTTNPYSVVTVYGNKTKVPWANSTGAQMIGNELRNCQMLGLSISWPRCGSSTGSGGHAITAWGDNINTRNTITRNPDNVRVTDSDQDTGGDVQIYDYDGYTSPNPGGCNNGNGWYINYSSNHPFIKHIVTLCPTDSPTDAIGTQKVVGSYRIHQIAEKNATDLHYNVRTDTEILTYHTWLDRYSSGSPSIREIGTPRKELQVDWDFSDKPVPYCTWITITTEFVLARYNAIYYRDVHFTYPPEFRPIPMPDIRWRIDTPMLKDSLEIPDITGGFLVGSFDVLNPQLPESKQLVGQYRFIHEYLFNQNPEVHTFEISGTEGFLIANVKFGHSYGYFPKDELWQFKSWMTESSQEKYSLGKEPVIVKIDWKGKLPYPQGEDFKGQQDYMKLRKQ